MSSRIIKIDSNQGSFDTTIPKSVCDIDIPANIGNVDLSKSYVLITTTVSGGGTNDKAGSVPNPYISYAVDDEADLVISDMSALVRNGNFSSRKGRIEDIRHIDILKNTLSCYNEDRADIEGGNNKLNTYELGVLYPSHQNNEISKVDDISSRGGLDHDIHIPLGNVFNSCKNDGFDTSSGGHGQSRLHFEFNFNLLSAKLNPTFANRTVEGSAVKIVDMKPQTNNTGGDLDVTTLTTSGKYHNKVNIPFYVGMPLSVSAKNDGGAAAVTQHFITKVQHLSTQEVVLTFDSKIMTLATTKQMTLPFVGLNPLAGGSSVAIKKIQLVAYLSDEPPPQMLNYTTFMSEEDSYPAVSNVSRMYSLPPACKNVYILFFRSAGTNRMRSQDANLTDYRITIDNRELCPRKIIMGGKIHNELIASVYANNGQVLKSLRQTQLINQSNDTDTVGAPQQMICFPVPFKPTQTLLQVELNGSGALSGHNIVYSEVARQI